MFLIKPFHTEKKCKKAIFRQPPRNYNFASKKGVKFSKEVQFSVLAGNTPFDFSTFGSVERFSLDIHLQGFWIAGFTDQSCHIWPSTLRGTQRQVSVDICFGGG